MIVIHWILLGHYVHIFTIICASNYSGPGRALELHKL